MSESIEIENPRNKEDLYSLLLPQLKSLFEDENNLIANCSNLCACLKEIFQWWWVGFYFIDENKNELVLGPFQGPIACTRIAKGKGVCGHAWQEMKAVIVPDVEKFPGHIACSMYSKSEIVIPFIHQNKCIGVLDVDSEYLDQFDSIDEKYLTEILKLIP